MLHAIGRTEIISNDQNPNFTAQFTLTYIFEEVQSLRLEVYDADTAFKTNDASELVLAKQDFQGEKGGFVVKVCLLVC